MSQGSHAAPPHPPFQYVPSRLCSILSAAHRFYSCCCYTKISDSAGGPDHLSSFASPDQLSYLYNCFDLLSFSSRWTRYDVAFSPLLYRPVSAILKPVYFRPSLCHCPIDRVCVSVSISLITSRKVFLMLPVLFLIAFQPLYESLHPAPYVYVCNIICLSSKRGYNHT